MKRFLKWSGLLLLLAFGVAAIPQCSHQNEGTSRSIGSVRAGALENGYLLPYKGNNFRYFSPMSYYVLDNAYLHSTVHKTVLEAYQVCEKTCPNTHFRLMECSNQDGGKIPIHWTHQNGLSVDFMSPKRKGDQQSHFWDRLGVWHYLLEFDDDGKLNLNSKVEIDFKTMAKHLLAVDDAARTNGLGIRKVIFKIELQDDLFATAEGAELRARGIYFVRRLGQVVNDLHDDHYHVDFEFL